MIRCNYVINLDRRKDRWDKFEKILNTTCLKNNNFIRFSAFDSSKHLEEIKRFNLEDHPIITTLKKEKVEVKGGLIGCFLSHIMVLQKIIDNDDLKPNDYVGIYEDDIYYSGTVNGFNDSYKNLTSIDLNKLDVEFLYIGGRFEPNFYILNDKSFVQTDNPQIFHRINACERISYFDRVNFSFIIRKDCCKKLIDIVSKNFLLKKKDNLEVIAIDKIYTHLYNNIKMFDYFPHIFYAIRNESSDITASLGVNLIQF